MFKKWHAKNQTEDNVLASPSRRKFLKQAAAATAAVAFGGVPAIAHGMEELAESEHDGQKRTENEKPESSEWTVEEEWKDVTQESITEMIEDIKERYGITVEMPSHAAMTDQYLEILSKRSRLILSDDHLYDAFVKYMPDMKRAELDDLRKKWVNMSEEDRDKLITSGIGKNRNRGMELTAGEKQRVLHDILTVLECYPEEMIRTIAHEELKLVLSKNENRHQHINVNRNTISKRKKAHQENLTKNLEGLSSGIAHDARIDIELNVREYPAEYKKVRSGPRKIPLRQRRKIYDEERFVEMPHAVLHHELFHRIDNLLYLEGKGISKIIDDTNTYDWRKMNDSEGGAPYDSGAYEGNGSSKSMHYGFHADSDSEDPYAKAHPIEDRAEIARMLMDGTYEDLMESAHDDPLLAQKIQIIKDDFWQLSSGIMDADYWEVMATGDYEKVRQFVRDAENGIRG